MNKTLLLKKSLLAKSLLAKSVLAKSVLAVAAMTLSMTASAEWPEKPIRLIVPYKAGGTTHSMSQVLVKALGKALGGAKIVVKNMPGGGSAVGVSTVANAKPDGYTIGYSDLNNMIWNPMAQESVKYKMSDLRLIVGLASYQPAIVALPDQPYKTFPELIEYSKENTLNVADMGGISKAILAYIAKEEGLKWNLIPTRGGGEMVPFLLGGKVDFAYSGGIHQKYGDQMNVLASFMGERLAFSPDAPSLQDLYGISQVGNAVMIAPAGLPDDIAKKLHDAGKVAMDDPDFTKILENIKFPKTYVSGEDLGALVADTEKTLQGVLEAIK